MAANFSRKFFWAPVAILAAWTLGFSLAGCGAFEDNGTHLAYALEASAKKLQASDAREWVVHYETLDGPDVAYYVELTPSLGDQPGRATQIWSSYLVVSGKRSGGTSYHNRFIFVPKRLYIQKAGGATDVVLRKNGSRIDVVELR